MRRPLRRDDVLEPDQRHESMQVHKSTAFLIVVVVVVVLFLVLCQFRALFVNIHSGAMPFPNCQWSLLQHSSQSRRRESHFGAKARFGLLPLFLLCTSAWT